MKRDYSIISFPFPFFYFLNYRLEEHHKGQSQYKRKWYEMAVSLKIRSYNCITFQRNQIIIKKILTKKYYRETTKESAIIE